MARRDERAYPQRSVSEEQRSQWVVSAKTLRAAGLLPVAGVGSAVTADYGDAPASPPWPPPKSLAAGPLSILKQALRVAVFPNFATLQLNLPSGVPAVVPVIRGRSPRERKPVMVP